MLSSPPPIVEVLKPHRPHAQMTRSEFAGFNVAVLKAATNTTANRNTTDTTAIIATAAADYATAFTIEGTTAAPALTATATAGTTITPIATAATTTAYAN
jgi:hypothetical protein